MRLIKSLKDISLIGIGDVTASAISAIFWFYLATLVLPEEYGEIHYFIGIATIASTLSLVGQQNTLTVYISKNKSIFSTLFFISLICSILSFIILYVFFNRFDIGLLAIGFVIFAHGIASNLGSQNFKKYTIYSIIQKSLMLIFSLSIFYFFGIEWILLGIAFSYFIYSKIFISGLKMNKFQFSEIKVNKKFIFSNYFLMLTNIITTQVDKLLIVPILGLAVLGNYSLAIQILTIMSILPSVIFKYVLPRASRNIIDVKLRQNVIIFSFVLAGIGVLVLPTILPIFFDKFTEVAVIIQIMSLSIIPLTINSFYYSKFLSLENAKIPLYGGIVSSIVLIAGMLILGSVYGTIGIAVTHVLTYSSLCLVSYIMDKRI